MAAEVFFTAGSLQTTVSQPPAAEAQSATEKHTTIPFHIHGEDVDPPSEDEDSSPEAQIDEVIQHDEPTGQPNPPDQRSDTVQEDQTADPAGTGLIAATRHRDEGSNLVGRRVTLVPRRTLSLSPAPARAGDMTMARNLRAARWLDFTDKDDDDGLYQPSSDSDSEAKRKSFSHDSTVGSSRFRLPRRTGSLNLGYVGGITKGFDTFKKAVSSMKRPLEVTLPCQQIQYLDIAYQQVQFSPIARKKINYHPVPYHPIHYCEVSYLGERPMKRKPVSL